MRRNAGAAAWLRDLAGPQKQDCPQCQTPQQTITAKAVIHSAEPQLFVADIKTACDFFTGKLGFDIAFSYGEPP